MKFLIGSLGFFLLTSMSCSKIYFTDLQTLQGRELTQIPNSIKGSWYLHNESAHVINNKGFFGYEMKDGKVESLLDSIIYNSTNIRLFKSEEFIICNQKYDNAFWDLTVFKPLKNGDVEVWLVDELTAANALSVIKNLRIESVEFELQGKKIETITVQTVRPEVDSADFKNAFFSGQLSLNDMRQLTSQIQPILLKKDGAILSRDENLFSTEYKDNREVFIPPTFSDNNSTNSTSNNSRGGPLTDKSTINSPGKYYALIIGNNNYQDKAIGTLDQPINDATKLYNVLTSKYTFDVSNTYFLKNASFTQMIEAFDNLSQKITPNDNLLIFYAGHGHWDENKELGYWLPVDAKQNSTAFWIANSRISDYMKSIKSKHTLLITDACFGGSIFKTRSAFNDASRAINELYESPSRKAMTSGNLNPVPDKSIFLPYLVKGLNDNQEKYLATDKLFNTFREIVSNNSSSTPQYGVIQNSGDELGEFIFIQRNK